VYVAGQAPITPKITLSPNPVSEGGLLTIKANIQFANGSEVKYGFYTATLYPAYDSNNYAAYTAIPAGEIPLWYNPALNLWVGNVTMPSSTSLGWIGGITPFRTFTNYVTPIGIVTAPVSGAWDAFVTGLTSSGIPTTNALSSQQGFTVSP
jgi:subtilase family serine protease